ncbi:DUF1804 family protein [Pasteurellaceae bacterium HPA106]|uniref:DUF1804 family protein n=1 Tax=Spirabiliibacterium pneumoniae TaxID=221400 RepID=UPI001AACFC6F|nr:DUF1804 family protein [Spirabiliibacterium pneumoniae]MBE2895467.1 DUF1804 family protein [Spirabiliibacterium pneumoniae]
MAHDAKTKAHVRRYYVFEMLTLEQSAEKAGVSFGTARRWKKQAQNAGDDWDMVREAATMAGGQAEEVSRGLLTRFILHFTKVMDEVENAEMSPSEKAELLSGLGDSFTKMTAASKRILPEVSELATAMKTIELFGHYIQSKKPHLLSDFLDLLDGFGQTLNKEFKQ